ncbi:MAG: hypothetical protein HZY73_16140 [Micropruina sp.]|nr:MAG: hypothetical protein HZY73_16140 [Micropruina sp.]
MCSPAACPRCGKTTWRGCGMHVDQVMARVPAGQRCCCAQQPARPAAWYPRQPYPTSR